MAPPTDSGIVYPRPEPLTFEEVEFNVYSAAQVALVIQALEEVEALACLNPAELEDLGRNMVEIDRYIRQLLALISIYENEVTDGQKVNSGQGRAEEGSERDRVESDQGS